MSFCLETVSDERDVGLRTMATLKRRQFQLSESLEWNRARRLHLARQFFVRILRI